MSSLPPTEPRSPRGLTPLDRVASGLCVAALVVMLLPLHEGPRWQVLFNAAHIPVFAVLAYAWAESLETRRWSRGQRLLLVTVGGMAFGTGIEFVQDLIPGRYGDFADLLRNAVGIGLGLVLQLRWPGRLAARLASR